MKKYFALLFLFYFYYFGPILAQTTHYLSDGKVIFEQNDQLLDITNGDSLRILKNVILVKYSTGIHDTTIQDIEASNNLVREYSCMTGWIIYNVPDTNNLINLVTALLTQIDSSKLSFDYPLTFFSTPSQPPPDDPDDPEYENQEWYFDAMQIPQAWEITTGNSDLKVGILDCGTDWNNDDIAPDSELLGRNFFDGSTNTNPDHWSNDHGTMLSSIIAARTNNTFGESGIAGGWNSPSIKIIMCKIGNNGAVAMSLADVAIEWALSQGVRLFTFSWGVSWPGLCTCGPYQSLKEAIDLAYDTYGATMFSSTGNGNSQNSVAWPACSSKVIAVGGTDNTETENRWEQQGGLGSNWGQNTDISAPGYYILAPYVIGNPGAVFPLGKLYEYHSGTSLATAIAVGIAALMQSVNPCLSNADVQYILQATAEKTGPQYPDPNAYDYNWDPTRPGHSQELGYGRINAYQAVLRASESRTEVASNENITFDTPKWFTHNLTLQPNSVLTITSTIKFNQGCKIIVMPGAQLIVNGGTLTTSCPGFWGGIEVQGNRNLAQQPISNQGYVHIYNNGKIEYANPGIYSVNGGIIIATDAFFINNQRSIIISNYPGTNFCTFKRCSFTLSDRDRITGTPYFIGAEQVEPIKVIACTFQNETGAAYPYRGIGVLSHDAEIYIFPQYPELPNQHDTIKSVFTGMTYGIYSLHSGAQYAIHIYDAIFDQNQKGAYLSGFNGSSYVEAYRNRFRVLDPGLPDGELQTYGMYLNNCTGYTIEENKFYCGAQDKNGYGLIINESGPYDNEVYNNAFYNLQTGSQAQGCNRYSDHGEGGLCYKCNDFFLNFNDILIISEAEPGTPNQGISIYQGTKSFTAKNTFTEGNNNSYDIHNPFDQIIYCSDGIPPGQMNFHPIPIFGVEEEIILNSTYNKIADCPSNTGGLPDLDELLGEYNQAQIESDSIFDDLTSLVDGGSTQELVTTVETSIPPEAVEITNELLSQSPYLSDSVMKSAIEKEAVLPNAMIRDILVENPQSAKSDALMEALEQRFIPMPDSMMAQIIEGQNILGAKEDKELELANRQQKASIAAKKLKRIYDTDTTGTFGIDSLISMVSEENSLMSHYDLVSLYYRKGMFETGNALLNNIPTIFQLTGDQQTVYDMYVALFPIIQQIVTNPNGLGSIDSMQVATLSSLARDDQYTPGAYARNILIKKGVLQYQEPILTASNLKETRRWKLNDPSHGSYDEFKLKIFPNPAKGYFVVEYRAAKEANKNGSLSVTLTTIAGKEVMNFSAGRNYDQIAVPTNNLPSGSYIVSLKWNGSTKDHVKLIISK